MSGELAMEFVGCIPSGGGGLFDRGKVPEVTGLPAHRHAGTIAENRSPAVCINALDAGNGADTQPGIPHVLTLGRESEIGDAVIQRISVDMVDRRLPRITMRQQPRKAMSQNENATDPDPDVYVFDGTSDSAGVAAIPPHLISASAEMVGRSGAPGENARVGVVVHALADEADIGQFARSHLDPPQKGRLVRGGSGVASTIAALTLT